MSFASEFKEFAMKGNVVDLAVGVIIGAAFGKIVDSIVKDLIMPVVGKIFGGLDFSNYFIKLSEGPKDIPQTYEALTKAGVPLFAYGNFITVALNFVILAFIIFLMIKQINRLKTRRRRPRRRPPRTPCCCARSATRCASSAGALAGRRGAGLAAYLTTRLEGASPA
jgi:large conductance mechanosensitive channel